MRHLVALVLALSAGAVAVAEGSGAPEARFVRTCTVFVEPSYNAIQVCQKRAGTPVQYSDAAAGGFVQIETPDCAGFVSDACLSQPEITQRGATAPAAGVRARKYKVLLGIAGGIDGTLATVSGTTDISRGDGWSFAARVQFALSRRLYVTGSPSYQVLGLTRTVDMSGALLDPNPAEFRHKVQFWGIESLAGVVIQRRFVGQKPTLDPEIALEGGLRFLSPVGASQTDSAGVTTAFTTADSPLLLLLGPTVDIAFSPGIGMMGFLHLFYNLRSSGGSRLFGARLGIALNFGLL